MGQRKGPAKKVCGSGENVHAAKMIIRGRFQKRKCSVEKVTTKRSEKCAVDKVFGKQKC